MPSDGKWTITPTTTASYKTRIIVRRPSNPARFNGTVIVEWMNVSAGESAPDWDFLNPMLMRDGYAYVGVSAQKLGVDGGTALLGSPGSSAPNTRAGRRRARPLRVAAPSRRPVRAGHVRPDRPGPARPARESPGRPEAHAHPGRRRVPVRLLPDDVRRRAPAADQRLRRHLHPQPRRFGCLVGRNIHRIEQRARQPAHPHRSEGPRLHVPDPDRPDPARLRPGAAAQHRQNPHLGDRRHRTRRRLHRGRGREPPRLHHAREQRPPAQRGPGRVHRLRQVGRQRHAAPEPATLHVVEHASGGIGARCARQRDRGSPHTGGRRPGLHPQRGTGRRLPTRSAASSGPPSPSPRPSSPASTAPRATTSPQYTKSLDKAIASGYILSADKASLLAQAEQVQFPA